MKRIGRYTLTADDIAIQTLRVRNAVGAGNPAVEPLELVDLFLKRQPSGAERVAAAVRMQQFAAVLPR